MRFYKSIPININLRFKNFDQSLKKHRKVQLGASKYFTFLTGSLLAISESLPFFESVKGNGILHVFSQVFKEYKEDLK